MNEPNFDVNSQTERTAKAVRNTPATVTAFLAAFFPSAAEPVFLRSFHPDKTKGDARMFPATTRAELISNKALQNDLNRANQQHGIYFVVNSGGNKDADITRYNAFFVENDELPLAEQHARLDAAPLPPSIRIETRKSVHAYWLIAEGDQSGVDESEFRAMQSNLIRYFDGDDKIKNPARVMRLPFFNHVSFDSETAKVAFKQVEITEFEPARRYRLEQMQTAFSIAPPTDDQERTATDENAAGDGESSAADDSEFATWDALHTTAKQRFERLPTAKRLPNGKLNFACPAHNGKGSTSGFSFPDGAYGCGKGCSPAMMREAVGLPAAPTSGEPASGTTYAAENADAVPELAQLPVLSGAALYGLAGDIVRMIEPHTEADNAALLIQLLAAFGSVINKTAYFRAEADHHYTKIFAVLIGMSSKGRKGSSWGQINQLMTQADESFINCVQDGLSSGEGLIYHVRDAQEKETPIKEKGRITGYQTETVDTGASEKRAFVLEPEFARVLRAMQREGNTLSSIIRQAWDSDRLRVMTKNPIKASNAHISIIGHITQDELRRNLDETETANGFANRFLWVFARRSKYLPEGGNLPPLALNGAAASLGKAIGFARRVAEMKRDGSARKLWIAAYHRLSSGAGGLLGAVTSRAESQVMRLACLYALLDLSDEIRVEHLTAALALWQYCEDSARYVFGTASGDKAADEILAALEGAGADGLDRTQINNLFQRNRTASQIKTALQALLESRRIERTEEKTAGRPREVFRVVVNEINEINEIRYDDDFPTSDDEINEINEISLEPDTEGDLNSFNSFNSFGGQAQKDTDLEEFEI